MIALSTVVLAAPQTGVPDAPDRPGRPTPAQAGSPNEQPIPPTTTSKPTGAGTDPTDDDLLRQTATDLGVPPPEARPDEQVLRWFGLRPQIEQAGFTFAGTLTADYSKNFQGGFETPGDDFRHLLDLRFSVDTQAAFRLPGGTFSIDFQQQNGANGSGKLTGDAQGFDNSDADGRTQISELWYQQKLFKDLLRLKFGKVDANSEFAFPANAAGFLNSSFGHTPTLLDMPTYPDPAMSFNAFLYPTRHYYVAAAVYDGSKAQAVNTGSYGPRNFFHGGHGYFLISEAGAQWAFQQYTLPGRVAVGGWYNTADFSRFDGTRRAGTGGLYALAEQTLWHKKYYNPGDPQGVAAFVQYGHADDHVNAFGDHAGGGLVWNGPWDRRVEDSVGLGLSYARLSKDPGTGFAGRDFELAAEAYYSLQATRYLQIKPDLQYLIHPAYTADRDAVVGTVRATLAF